MIGLSNILGTIGTKSLPVFELPLRTANSTLAPGATWNGTFQNRPNLQFSGFSLAQAVVQADFLQYRNPIFPSIGFLLQCHHLFDWTSPTLALKPGAATLLGDFARSSLCGRIGQGLAILFAQSQGYTFTAHLREHLVTLGVPIRNAKNQLLPIADFVCDGSGQVRSLVESKASFAVINNDPREAKRTLRKGLITQVNPWMTKINPSATKSFVVCSYMREIGVGDPSALAFLDPEHRAVEGELPMSHLDVKRQNYAAWMSAMGLIEEAERLRDQTTEGIKLVPFFLYELGQHVVAFPLHYAGLEWGTGAHEARTLSWIMPGIGLDALRAISAAAEGNVGSLEVMEGRTVQDGGEGQGYTYSVFPDQTFFGSVIRGVPLGVIEVPL